MEYLKLTKEERIEYAKNHFREMQNKFEMDIEKSIKSTKIYDVSYCCNKDIEEQNTSIIVCNMDSVKAAYEYKCDNKIAILNFASYKHPGGGYIVGSIAQEECLCYSSNLYNIIGNFNQNFYEWNRNNLNKSLYLNRALYTPNVLFEYNKDTFYCDVITCAAPNKNAAQKYNKISNKKNYDVLYSRIKFILDIAKDNHVDTLVLGAFGCGVFGQNPREVANIFKKLLDTSFKGCFKKVVFGIPKGNNDNLEQFKLVFRK